MPPAKTLRRHLVFAIPGNSVAGLAEKALNRACSNGSRPVPTAAKRLRPAKFSAMRNFCNTMLFVQGAFPVAVERLHAAAP